MQAARRRRAGPLFGALLVIGAMGATITPVVPRVAAADPSGDPTPTETAPSQGEPSPSASATDSPEPGSPTPAPAPSEPAEPTQPPPEPPSATPSEAPSATPTDSPTSAPSDPPSAEPTDDAVPSGSPEPSPSESAAPSSPPAQILPLAKVSPGSPHVIDPGLQSDTCAACHRTHTAPGSALLPAAYRAEPLRAAGEAYRAADFGLCWTCHASTQKAIEDLTGATPGTNFPAHGLHLRGIAGHGSGGTDITVPGAGQGNALCAECHANLHATSSDERGLVRFAPDVEQYNGQPISYDATTGTCLLTCHGVTHDGATITAP